MKILLLLFVVFLFNSKLIAQDDVINAEMSSSELNELNSSQIMLAEVESNYKEITKNDETKFKLIEENVQIKNKKQIRYNDKKILELDKESIRLLIESADLYYESYKLDYATYKHKLLSYQLNDRDKRLKVNYFIEESKKIKTKIRLLNEEISKVDELKLLKQKLDGINLLRTEGVDKLKEAFCTFLNCYEVSEVKYTSNSSNVAKFENKNKVEFRIQILASSLSKDIEKLRKYYKITDPIQKSYNSDLKLYRYTIGSYDDYYIAKDYAENIGISDAFVVSFINGKRSDIEYAISLSLKIKEK